MLDRDAGVDAAVVTGYEAWPQAPDSWAELAARETIAAEPWCDFETEFPPWEKGGFPSSEIGFTCSDTRNWVQAGLFRRAMLTAERDGVYQAGEEDLEDHEENESSS
jgi:hypothetical protein